MIRIIKSEEVPPILTESGENATEELCRSYEANPTEYNSGTSKFTIKRSIYGHASVKKQLQFEQHDKCCFCEADFTANGYGDVEHFRPKAGFKSTWKGKLNRPGYYWLAYDWQNLFFSCEICNRRHKKNFFPLENEANRAHNHRFDLNLEESQLIHPSVDNPNDHLEFRRHVVVNKTVKGQKSIQAYGLARPKINYVRENYLQCVRNNIALASVDLDTIGEEEKRTISRVFKLPWSELEDLILIAKEFLAVAASDRKPFSLMVRQNFPQLPYEP